MTIKCILVCARQMLLAAALEDLLAQLGGLEVVEIVDDNEAVLQEAIERIKPDIVILCQSTHHTNPTRVIRLLMQYSQLHVITVSAVDNLLHIYGKQEIMIQKTSDLISAITLR